MSAIKLNPYDTLQGSDGLPLDAGYIYVGAANLDPQTNPITVYWDAALTIPAKQPIRTANGRVYNNGTPALLYLSPNYSIQVLDRNKAQVFLALNVAQAVDNPVSIAQGGTGASTAAAALANLGVISAIVNQTYGAYTTAGTAAAFTLTPSPALGATAAKQRFNVTFHISGTATPTLSINGLTAKNLKQYNATGAKVNPLIVAGMITDVVDDGTDYLLLNPFPGGSSGGGGSSSGMRRQVVQFGLRDANNNPAFLAAGAGLNFNILAASVNLAMSFAAGFGSTGPVDNSCVISADASNQGALGFNCTNYAYAAYVNSISATWVNTKAPPQYGRVYDRSQSSLLQFAGAAGSTQFLDDFGNTWSAQGGAKVQTNQFKFGTGGLGGGGAANALNGTTDYIRSSSFTSLGEGSWSMRAWAMPTAFPGAGVFNRVMSAVNASDWGAQFGIFNNAGVMRWTVNLSSDGTSGNLGFTAGTSAPVLNNWHFIELTFDALLGAYKLYVNGVQEVNTVTSARICRITAIGVGANPTGAASTFFAGYIDKPEVLRYCDHPAGVAYTPPIAAPVITANGYASEWYDIHAGLMRSISAASAAAGTNPSFVTVNHLYLGELDTNGTNVTATRPAAYNGEYDSTGSPVTYAVSTSYTFNHNIGVPAELIQLTPLARANTVDYPWTENPSAVDATPYSYNAAANLTRCSAVIVTGNNGMQLLVNNFLAGVRNAPTTGEIALRARRAF